MTSDETEQEGRTQRKWRFEKVMDGIAEIEWRAAGEGQMAGDQSLSCFYYKRGDVWEWQVVTQYGKYVARGEQPSGTLAKAECEFWYSRLLRLASLESAMKADRVRESAVDKPDGEGDVLAWDRRFSVWCRKDVPMVRIAGFLTHWRPLPPPPTLRNELPDMPAALAPRSGGHGA